MNLFNKKLIDFTLKDLVKTWILWGTYKAFNRELDRRLTPKIQKWNESLNLKYADKIPVENSDRTCTVLQHKKTGIIKEISCSSYEDAETIVTELNKIRETNYFVSVANLKNLMEIESRFIDQNWGWEKLDGFSIREDRNNFIIDVPTAIPLARN